MTKSDALPIQWWATALETFNEKEVPGTFQRCFCHPWNKDDTIYDQLDFDVNDNFYLKIYNSSGTLTHTLNYVNTTGTVYTISFRPQDYGYTSGQMQLKIFQGVTERFRSDCLDIQEDHDETVLIWFSDNKNYAGIKYGAVTPDPEFCIRIPARFAHERFPEESETIELSNSRSIQLNGEVKAQRLLEVQHVPYYFHRKLKLILKHQFIEIDDIPYIQEEVYEQNEGSQRTMLRTATVWLTEKDYYIRNVL